MSLDTVQKLKENDISELFNSLVDTYQVAIRNTCFGFVRNKSDAEDLAQEVFIEAFRSFDKFRDEAKISTWLYRIAINRSLNFIRNNKRSVWSKLFSLTNEKDETIQPIHPVSEDANPQEILEREEDKRILDEVLDSLPENQRIAFVMHKMEGLSYKKIASIMDVSLSSVESLIFRANKTIRLKLFKKMKKNK